MQNSNVDWITTKELAEIKGVSERAIRKAIRKKKYVVRKCLKSYEILRKRINVETYYELASDVVEDGDIKINDVAKLCQYVEKKISSLEE